MKIMTIGIKANYGDLKAQVMVKLMLTQLWKMVWIHYEPDKKSQGMNDEYQVVNSL